jgi:hypothetical protein
VQASAYFVYSSKYGTVSNFLFQNMHQLLFQFLGVQRLIS